MRKLIKKILREDFQNPEVSSLEHNICDVMTVSSWDEIQFLLDKMDYDDQFKPEIDVIKNQMKKEKSVLGTDLDITNDSLRKIQNIVCK